MSEGSPSDDARAPDRPALVIAVLLAAVALVIAISTMRAGGVAGYSPVGPKTVPWIISGAFGVLAIFTAIAALRGDFPEREPQDVPPMIWIVGGLAVQMLTMKTVGFSIATGLLFAATARAFGRGPLVLTVPVGILFSFLVWYVFAKGLQLSLPSGAFETTLSPPFDWLFARLGAGLSWLAGQVRTLILAVFGGPEPAP